MKSSKRGGNVFLERIRITLLSVAYLYVPIRRYIETYCTVHVFPAVKTMNQ
jgi:hypothetical protein